MQTPPITQPGMESRNATKGEMKEIIAVMIAAVVIVTTEALPVIATQPTDSPYVVLGQPPKIAPAKEPIPSPSSVQWRPGSSRRSDSMIEERFLWSAMCSANTTNATGI